ncbi:bacteriocin resistance YdeI/OmpD-like protein [Shimia isoporae]|uniref:Bacteriocin resistance YdeI/OmpD-like protein n=1 Tax=Shimia isoporae TaxID=647720 RepID=A0A4R1N2P3_9RHOB|nr:bacteriocin resistance YdeI/OmpD-like protein [Shimia isoporae]
MPMEWGKSTYTVLPLPESVLEALNHPKRVEGEIADHPVNLAVSRAPVISGAFLWTGKSLLSRIGVSPDDLLDVRLKAADPDYVDMPEDVVAQVQTSGLAEQWDALTAGKKRGLLHPIESAKRAETRQKRIDALLASLRESRA